MIEDKPQTSGNAPALRLKFWPDWRGANPYQELFYQALSQTGVAAEPGLEFTKQWLLANRKEIDVIHIHWPEGIWRRPQSWKEPIQLLRFRSYLRWARRLGIKVLWTVHNLRAHEGGAWCDEVGYDLLLRYADLVIVHSTAAAREVESRRSLRARVVVMPHGNYEGSYPRPRPRDSVLRSLGLRSDLPVVACLGHLREYKGLDIAIAAVSKLGGAVQIIIAGQPHESFDVSEIADAVAGQDWACFVPRMLSASEFADYSAASDIILLPYRRITGSGALLGAWSFGRHVIASDLPYFAEQKQQHTDALTLFSEGDAGSLAAAITHFLALPESSRNEGAENAREATAWPRVIVPVVQAMGIENRGTPGVSRTKRS